MAWMVYIKGIEPNTFLHFYQRGDAFRLRDYSGSPSSPPRDVLRDSTSAPPRIGNDIRKMAELPGNFILKPPEAGRGWEDYEFWHEATVAYNRAYLNHAPPHIEQLVVQNYRVLKEITLDDLQPMSVVLGPNGCGKSTLFDVFGFLSAALQTNVKKAIEARGRIRELRSRGSMGPIGITIRYRESTFEANEPDPVITYHVAIDGREDRPYVCEEYLQWRRGSNGKPFRFLDMKDGRRSSACRLLPVRYAVKITA